MRKFILITAMVLASATAQAGQSRNLSPVAANDEPPVVTTATTTARQPKAAEADTSNGTLGSPQYQAPTPPTPPDPPASPAYEARPPAVAPVATTQPAAPPLTPPPATTTSATATPTAKADAPRRSAKAGKGRRGGGGYWTETRIIGELHRYGIYW